MSEEVYRQLEDEVGRRWPALGAYACHPLGGWFFRRAAERPVVRGYRPRPRTGTLLFLFLVYFMNHFGFFIFIALQVLLRALRARGRVAQPSACIIGRSSSALPELWLSGVGYEELAFMEVVLALSGSRRSVTRIVTGVLWFAAGLVGFFMFFHQKLDTTGQLVAVAALICWGEIYYLFNNANCVAQRAVRDFGDDLDERLNGKTGSYIKHVLRLVLGCAVVGAVCLFAGVALACIPDQHQDLALLIALSIAALYMSWHVIYVQPWMTQSLFAATCARVSGRFTEIIRAEAEQNERRRQW